MDINIFLATKLLKKYQYLPFAGLEGLIIF